ncbi:hypothetical protein DEFR109230_19355 [Deinococcus frigens]
MPDFYLFPPTEDWDDSAGEGVIWTEPIYLQFPLSPTVLASRSCLSWTKLGRTLSLRP